MFDPRISIPNNNNNNNDDDDDHVIDPYRISSDSNDSSLALNSYHRTLQFSHNDDESGSCSPPLWKTSPRRSPVHPRHQNNNYRLLSQTATAQAIARGQRELMEMVKNMPESSYELSLKDLVEYPREESQEECLIQEINHINIINNNNNNNNNFNDQDVSQEGVKVKRQISNNKQTKMVRNGSIDNRGLFLKMVFPMIGLRSNKKKTKGSSLSSPSLAPPPPAAAGGTISTAAGAGGGATCAKVSSSPEVSEKASKGVDKDWWRKRFSTLNESSDSSGVTSSNSGSSGSSGSSSSSSRKSIENRKRKGWLSSCCSCFQSRKNK